jgi:hypothetical protein
MLMVEACFFSSDAALERGCSDRPLTVGPFEFAQLTYELLRLGERDENDGFADYQGDQDWVILMGERVGERFSDVTIYPVEVDNDD